MDTRDERVIKNFDIILKNIKQTPFALSVFLIKAKKRIEWQNKNHQNFHRTSTSPPKSRRSSRIPRKLISSESKYSSSTRVSSDKLKFF